MTISFGFPDKPADAVMPPAVQTDGIPEDDEMSVREKALRDLFVAEYLVDYNQLTAAMRCGFGRQMAKEYADKFMSEPYVQRRISQLGIGKNDDSDAVVSYNKKRIIEGFTREAFYHGPGSSHSARVAALKALAELHGMQPKTGKPGENGPKGGVMSVPAIADLNEWEAAASMSQDALVQHAGNGE